jgi:adenylate cyclase
MGRKQRVRGGRRLSAILAADVAGYSRLMHNDEEATHAKLTALLTDAVAPAIAEHGGRIVKNTGDGFLADFPSAVEAVRAAVQFQTRIDELTISDVQDKRIAFRVGINIGDVIVESHDIFGDGVNVAVRIEGVAAPGGMCISSSAYDQVRGKIDAVFEDMGPQALKNIAEPIRVWRVKLGSTTRSVAPTAVPAWTSRPLALPDKPSIAVLPFENMTRKPDQQYFADGVTEDIITELSRFSELFVIARNSSFQFKGKACDLRQVGLELGVRYVLEGSIRRDGNRIRITAQLIDAETGAHRWAERYDRKLEDVFSIQDEVARTIATILVAHVSKAEAERSLLKPPAAWKAYDHYMRASSAWAALVSSWKIEDLNETRRCLADALAIDPQYARALTLLASTHRVAWLNPLNDEYLSPPALDRAIQLVRLAIEFDPQLPDAYAELGYTIVRKREFDAAAAAAERAIALNPNFADYRVALVFFAMGEHAKAIEIAKAQIRLDPFHPYFAPLMAGEAFYMLGQYHEALHLLREAIGRTLNHQYGHAWLAATYAQLGQLASARAEAAEVLRINPKYTISETHRRISVFKRTEDTEHLVDGLRKAGLPE